MTSAEEFMKELSREPRNPIKKWFRHRSYLGYNGWYWLTHPWKLPIRTVEHIKSIVLKFWQRGTKGFADQDTWSLDWFILSWLPEAIEMVANTSHGYPSNYGFTDEEVDNHIASSNGNSYEIDSDLSYKLYVKECRNIANLLREVRKEYNITKFNEAWSRLGKIFFDLWT